jgi:predicted transcriptional regulator
MKKASNMTYKVGSLKEFADWTRRVVRNPSAAQDIPKTWYDSEQTAKASGTARPVAAEVTSTVSAEAMVKLLSPTNMVVLNAIRDHHPASVRELAILTKRKEASLSRTLNNFSKAGIITLTPGPHRTKIPVLIAKRVHLDIDLTGRGSAVAVDADVA